MDSEQKYPLTTQAGLRPDLQQLLDAQNLDELRELEAQGKPLTGLQQKVKAELEEKQKAGA